MTQTQPGQVSSYMYIHGGTITNRLHWRAQKNW